MTIRTLLHKAVKLSEFQDVNLSLITKDKIVGDVNKNSAKDIIPLAIKYDYVISFTASAIPNRLDFEVFKDLPF